MPTADLILKNVRVITVDPSRPSAELVAIKGHKILLVGSDNDLELVKGVRTKVIDCEGKTVVPGFNDAHCHPFSLIRNLLSIDLSPSAVRSISDIKAAIKKKARNTPEGQWITGTGYNDFYLAEKRHPDRHDVDEVAPDHPVLISHRSLHACVLNSKALELAGISIETPEPPGAVIDREVTTGEPSGLLFEMLGYIREKVMPPLSDAELDNGMKLSNEHYLSQGITSIQNASAINDLKRWQTCKRYQDSNKLKTRIYLMCGAGTMAQFLEAGMTTGSGDDRLRLGGVKIVLHEATGKLYPSQPELNQQVLNAHKSGFQLAIHAVQPSTLEVAIIALENIYGQPAKAGMHHRIEHCSECPPSLLERLKRLQAVIATQPPFIYFSGERYLAQVPVDDQQWLYRFKSFFDAGLVVAGSSDSPIVPDNPLIGMCAAVMRQTENAQQLLPAECVSARQALAMYTINAAYASLEDKIKGSITRGKLADLVLLSSDPTRVPAEQIKDIKVEMTIINGKVVWET